MVLQGCASFPERLTLLGGLNGACRVCLTRAVLPGCLMGCTLQVQPLHAGACGSAKLSGSELVPGNCLGKGSMAVPANRKPVQTCPNYGKYMLPGRNMKLTASVHMLQGELKLKQPTNCRCKLTNRPHMVVAGETQGYLMLTSHLSRKCWQWSHHPCQGQLQPLWVSVGLPY